MKLLHADGVPTMMNDKTVENLYDSLTRSIFRVEGKIWVWYKELAPWGGKIDPNVEGTKLRTMTEEHFFKFMLKVDSIERQMIKDYETREWNKLHN